MTRRWYQRWSRTGLLYLLTGPLLAHLAGCASSGRSLMPTPNLYAVASTDPFAVVPEDLRAPLADLVFVTDRASGTDKQGNFVFTHERSHSMAFGSVAVSLGEDLTWEKLVAASRSEQRSKAMRLEVQSISELGRFPDTPLPLMVVEGEARVPTRVENLWQLSRWQLVDELRRRLEASPRREILLYIHGFNNSFDEAAWTTAELWHFLGRVMVPLVYTWPAGRGAGPKGYAYDRESGEFTIFHLKQLLRILGQMPEVEGIHVIAHSRGTDVAVSALRELIIAARAGGRDPAAELGIANLVIVASDMDLEVFSQRWLAERLGVGVGGLTIYTSSGDRAIGFARAFFSSQARLGRLDAGELGPDQQDLLSGAVGLSIIELAERANMVGHTYFYDHPAASCDLILLLGRGCEAGQEGCRPLEKRSESFWRIPPGYPAAVSETTESTERTGPG